MTPSNEFFLIFLGTILIVRLFLFLKPIASPTIGGFRIHHYMYGIVAVLVGLFIHSTILYAVGLGLYIDELAYLIIGGKTHADNYSAKSLVGTALFVSIVFVCKEYLVLLTNW